MAKIRKRKYLGTLVPGPQKKGTSDELKLTMLSTLATLLIAVSNLASASAAHK